MPTLKVSSEFKTRLTRAARQRKIPVSELVRTSVEKDVPNPGRGFLLGRLKQYAVGPSTYDPAKPAFDDDAWDTTSAAWLRDFPPAKPDPRAASLATPTAGAEPRIKSPAL